MKRKEGSLAEERKSSSENLSAALLVRDLFYGYGVTFHYGGKQILEENKSRARAYTKLLESFRTDIVERAISDACADSPKRMPSVYLIQSHCRHIRNRENRQKRSAGEQMGLDETHTFDGEKGEWVPQRRK